MADGAKLTDVDQAESGQRASTSPTPAMTGGRKQLLANMRRELLTAAATIVGQSQILYEDVLEAEAPQEFLDDLGRIVAASKAFYAFVKEHVDPESEHVVSEGFDEWLRETRHDIGNQLNHVMGNLQLFMLGDQTDYFGSLSEELESIEAKCKACVATLARYKNPEVESDRGFAAVLDRESLPRAGAEVGPRDNAPPAAASAGPARVLVVDDKAPNREQLAKFLSLEGHQVAVACDGREAIESLKREDFDLVLLDLIMPEMNGFQVLQEVQEDERLKHTPVIIVSGFSEPEHVVSCIEMGAVDHLPKPIDFKLLRARVHSCLERRRLREREFGQYFTPELARHFVRRPELLKVARQEEISVLFCDIRGFSRISERLGPAETVDWLSDVMETFSDCVMEHHGVLVDYIGDELMAMWGAPERQSDHAELACRAAIAILNSLPAINERWEPRVGDRTAVGIGINTGVARVGNTGSRRKFKYGPLGDTVNLASRVQGATKYLKTDLLITGSTHAKLQGCFPSRRVCQVRVVNINRPVQLYEIFNADSAALHRLGQRYEEALGQFEHGDFDGAAATIGTLLNEELGDGPSLLLMSRIVHNLLDASETPDPVWTLPGK